MAGVLEDGICVDDRPGWLDAAARVLKQLLRAPGFKADLRSVLNQIDPGYAPGLVKTAIWTDPSVAMAVLAALPRAANALILTAAGLIQQAERFPPALLANFLRDNLGRIELRTLGRVSGWVTGTSLMLATEQQDWPALARQYSAGLADTLPPTALAEALVRAAGLAERIVADHPEWIQALSEAVTRTCSEHPELVDKALVPLLGPLLDAVLRHRPGAK